MAIQNLRGLLIHTMQDVYYAEKQILKALPKMASKAGSAELRQVFESHKKETEGQVQRLEQAFEMLGEKANGVKCYAIEGIIKEANELMDEIGDADTLDAGLIAASQAVEHYEITRYGTLVSWAKLLGLNDVSNKLRDTLDEEKDADARLTRLAEDHLNAQATS